MRLGCEKKGEGWMKNFGGGGRRIERRIEGRIEGRIAR